MSIKSSSQLGLLGLDSSILKARARKAIGGTITEDSYYIIHTFTGSGTFYPIDSLVAEILIVGAGGAGSYGTINATSTGGGGGGAGGVVYKNNYSLTPFTSYSVVVGAGGTGGPGPANTPGIPNEYGTPGDNSSFGIITAQGGGGGGTQSRTGKNGGSGGGGGNGTGQSSGTYGQGNIGGGGFPSGGSAGGGGARNVGQDGQSLILSGNGGDGVYIMTGTTMVFVAGGGGGGLGDRSPAPTVGTGGRGGGGNGGAPSGTQGSVGTINTGGGAGGSGGFSAGVNGGSGIVIVRYLKQPLPTIVTNNLLFKLDGSSYGKAQGTTWTDQSSSAYTGSLTTGVTYSNDFGGSLNFTGSSNYASFGNILDFSTATFSSGFTIDIWTCPTLKPTSSVQSIFSSAWGTSGTQWQVYVWYDSSNRFGTTQRYSGSQNDFSTVLAYPLNNWYNITVTSNNSTCTIYINGVSISSSATGQPNNSDVTRDIRIGGFPTYSGADYYGKVGSVNIYNRPLTATEVLQNFNALRNKYYI